jgi:hypothetical protein
VKLNFFSDNFENSEHYVSISVNEDSVKLWNNALLVMNIKLNKHNTGSYKFSLEFDCREIDADPGVQKFKYFDPCINNYYTIKIECCNDLIAPEATTENIAVYLGDNVCVHIFKDTILITSYREPNDRIMKIELPWIH